MDWKTKLTSRKLWMAVAAFVAGLVAAFSGIEMTPEAISGLIMLGATAIAYIIGEGFVDGARASTPTGV